MFYLYIPFHGIESRLAEAFESLEDAKQKAQDACVYGYAVCDGDGNFVWSPAGSAVASHILYHAKCVADYMREHGIEKIVKDITGSGKVEVVVTLESSIRYSYAESVEETKAEKNDKESQSLDNELKEGYITVKTADGGEEALLVTARMPEIRGIAIVCEGGDNEIINQKIQNAVMAALNITSKRVYICGRK